MSNVQSPSPMSMPGHLLACAAGASIDNVFRLGIGTTLAALAINESQAQQWNQWVMILFTVPFLLVAPTAGSLGDRWPKHWLIRAARIADVIICIFGVLGIWLHHVPLMLATVALLATTSAFFAPVKLSVVPELVSAARLPRANGQLAGVTVLAILGGMGLSAYTNNLVMLMLITAGLCLMGVIGAFLVAPLTAAAPSTPIAMPWSLIRQVKALNQSPGVWIPVLSLAGFWALGAAASVQLVPLVAKTYATAGDSAELIALTALALGLGLVVGSVIAARVVSRAFPAGLPIIGALIAGTGLAAAGWHAHGDPGSLSGFRGWLFVAGIGAGLWEVPLTIMLQERALPTARNLVMGGATILSNLATIVLVGSLMPLTDGTFGHALTASETFILIGVGTMALAAICAWIYRLQLVAALVVVVTRCVWRLRLTGGEHLPATGGCLIIANHLSYADGIALCAKLDRPVRFLVYRKFFAVPVIGFVLRAVGAIPVAAEDSRRALMASLDAAVDALKRGEVVAIFPEGKLTRSGTTDRFKSGLERIASRADVPVLPVYLDGLFGTWMSRAATRAWPRLGRRVAVRVGPPLPATVSTAEARQAVMALGNREAQTIAEHDSHTLASKALSLMRWHPRATCVLDAQGRLANWQVMGVARALIPLLGLAPDEQRVGLLLPPGRSGVLANFALALAGRTAINLNHTAGPAALQRMCEIAGITTIITATPYLKRIGDSTLLAALPHIRWVKAEELIPRVSKAAVLWQALLCLALPARWLTAGTPDEVAAIVFSSGSTGDPKGVQLTNRQILANCRVTKHGLDLQAYADVVLSPLPLFHSFGLVPGMWLGLTHGLSIAAHPDPTDGATIGRLAHELRATFLIATPTFVRGWMRRIEPEQFATLRLAVVGAERCPAELKAAFKERYGVELLEGYGCTELAPTVAVNLPELRRDGECEVRSKAGSVGRPLPGLHAFTVDPATGDILPPDHEGLIVIRSPSRMLGYFAQDALTAKALVAEGYNTGDIGRIDSEGFLFITGRLARFAKIAGEMVPLDNVEALLQAGLPAAAEGSEIELAVAAVADESRGERLVVLHTGFTGDWTLIFAQLDQQPAIWKPKLKDIRQVPAIPRLGTGKRDLAGLKKLAAEALAVS